MKNEETDKIYESSKQINTTISNTELTLGFKTDLLEKEIIDLLEKSAKKLTNSKSIEIIGKMLENIKIDNKNDRDIKLYLKNEGKTRFHNVVQYDKLSSTISAYYHAKKPNKTILSDKDAAEYRSMNITNQPNFTNDDEKNISLPIRKSSKNEEFANISNTNSIENQNSLSHVIKIETKNYSLKRKRRPTSKIKKDMKKMAKLSKNDDFEELLSSRNYANNDDEDDLDEDQKYCITECLNNRKYEDGTEMIECDDCKNWYHPQCVKMSEDQFEKFKLTDWRCLSCKK